ncbi:hypothetical protein Y5W_01508 [Alcanivorax sp. 521-1]|uniref:Lipoprotein n=1 Tax=Alloalcanivorax profundimaris TaxID=2735259 RepID=A0ABS0AQJ3_9GAMM|nr:hypothetical protein [Alloalcanivorax profundimaris]MBF5056214.1 hypothetical protein [Alloalcanivorax profundimaris]
MRALFLAPLLILSALLVACGDTPDDGVIRDALEQELQRAHLDELFTVTEVEILEAYPQDNDDQLTLDVRYTMEARQGLSEYSQTVKNDEQRDAMDRFAMVMALAAVRVEFGDFEEGDTFNQERRLDLRRTDEGWRIPRPER